MGLKRPLSLDEQIKKLKSHNLLIDESDDVKSFLSRVNYYRFTGYALEFRVDESSSDFINGTTYQTIRTIYEFDKELRELIQKHLLEVEVYYRTQISNIVSIRKCREFPHDQHYDLKNYYNRNSVAKIFQSIEKEIGYHKDELVVKHHNEVYAHKMPLWVIVELISFSNLSKYYNSLYKSDKVAICESVGIDYKYLANWLYCMSVLRNKCAHGNRIYNIRFNPPAKMSKGFLQSNRDVSNQSLVAHLYILNRMLPNDVAREQFTRALKSIYEKYRGLIDFKKIQK